ncbi:MAG: tetratricopeptide repeat protein [Proteobacteria bacterium]|nr:tetratricopeptide repeat protein [Pseudomonadota bacterium]
MIDITIENFEAELIQASVAQPVLLDIWAPWCGPCKSLGPILEKLEVAYGGRFKLAKLNSDEQPEISGQLSQAFGVRSIPFCVMFVGGAPVDGFVGALPESQVREFLDKHVPSEDALEAQEGVAEAEALLDAGGSPEEALARLYAALETDPANLAARLDAARIELMDGQADAARALLAPVAAEAIVNVRVAAFQQWLTAVEAGLQDEAKLRAAIAANRRDFDARLALARQLMAQGNWPTAMDELLEIIMRDKAWGDEAPRKLYVAMLELMTKPAAPVAEAAKTGALELTGKAAVTPADPLLDQYRRKLSMALF